MQAEQDAEIDRCPFRFVGIAITAPLIARETTHVLDFLVDSIREEDEKLDECTRQSTYIFRFSSVFAVSSVLDRSSDDV